MIFQRRGVRTPCPPLWIRQCKSRNFQSCRDDFWVEPVLNRVERVLRKETLWRLQRDSNQRRLYLKSSTLPLIDSTGIIQLFGHCIATWYAMSQSHLKLTEIGTSCRRGKTVNQKPIRRRHSCQPVCWVSSIMCNH